LERGQPLTSVPQNALVQIRFCPTLDKNFMRQCKTYDKVSPQRGSPSAVG
jgi:hypothetical protein